MVEKELRVRTDDGEMTTFVARPDGEGPFPVAVLYMDAPGYREQIKANARRFAADGYFVVAPDLFYRDGDGITVDIGKIAAAGWQGPEMERLMSLVQSVTPERARADTEAILRAVEPDAAASAGPKVSVGYCMGARLALHAASTMPDQFVATAGIHPGTLITDEPSSPHHDLDGVRGELYFAFAEEDPSATPEMVDRFRTELAENNVRGTVERVPGTHHGFAMADLPVYQQEAAERHFERTLDLWRRNLAQEPVGA